MVLGDQKQSLDASKPGLAKAKQGLGKAKQGLGAAKQALGSAKQGAGAAKRTPGEAKPRIVCKRNKKKCVWTAQARTDCVPGRVMRIVANHPQITSSRKAKSI